MIDLGPARNGSWDLLCPSSAALPSEWTWTCLSGCGNNFCVHDAGERPMRVVATMLALALLSSAASAAWTGCGCKGGPGYGAPNGRCVGWATIGRTCGSPATLR